MAFEDEDEVECEFEVEGSMASDLDCLRCPCGGTDYRWRLAPPNGGASVGVAACSACGLSRTVPPPYDAEQDFAGYSGMPDPVAFTAGEEAIGLNLARRVLLCVPPAARRGRLLDVGAGFGFTMRAARDLGWDEAIGTELNEAQAAFAASRWGLGILTGDLDSLGLEPASFDTVVFKETLEHLVDPASHLLTARRLLLPGGILVVHVPNFEGWMPRTRGIEWVGLVPDQHVWQFTPGSMRDLVERAGFKVDCVSARISLYYPPDTRSALHRAWWMLRWYPVIRGQELFDRADSLVCVATPGV